MKKPESNQAFGLFVDIGQALFLAVSGDTTFKFALDRTADGRLTELSREKLTTALRGFVGRQGRNALCAIDARGVSIRRLTLPAAAPEEMRRVLRLQIESEFPVSPDELAWGSRPVGMPTAKQELLLAAVKKEALEQYVAIFTACGVTPFFTVAALARADFCPSPSGIGAVLDIGQTHSELLFYERGLPSSIRVLAWGSETVDEAALLDGIKSALTGAIFYWTGNKAGGQRLAALLHRATGGTVACESLDGATAANPSTAIAGLRKSTPLILELDGGDVAVKMVKPAGWKWAAAAVFLALAAFLYPYAEAIALKPVLEKKLAALQADHGRLATIDQEVDFLKFLKQNQPPYLDAIYLLAGSAPQGMRLDSLSLGRHQQIDLRFKVANARQVSDFRSKVVDSGWFTNVIVEEQTPMPDRSVIVRMTAELKTAESRKPLATESPGKKRSP